MAITVSLTMIITSFAAISFDTLGAEQSYNYSAGEWQESLNYKADEFEEVHFTHDFIASAADHLFEGVGTNALHQILQDEIPIYGHLRVYSDYGGTMTYRVPVQRKEIEYVIAVMDDTLPQPFDINPFPVTRIMYSGRSHEDSIVIILLSDGFTEEQHDIALNHAKNAMDSMLDTRPFNFFRDIITIYFIHTTGTNTETGIGYLGTIRELELPEIGTTVTNTSATMQTDRIHELVDSVVARPNQTMIQVIANAGHGTGWAWMQWHYLLNATIGVTSIRYASHPTPGGSNILWPNGTAWHSTFIHEFGHSFGNLVDEHERQVGPTELRANSTSASIADIDVKWRHWAGYRNVLETPTRFPNGWAVPAYVSEHTGQSGCMMRGAGGNRDFCGVCTAELIRRMAHISGEAFHGRSPVTTNPLPNTPIVTMSTGATRILDSAFHGNTSLNTMIIPPSVRYIGDFAFIGATGLRIIENYSTTPQQINSTTFAGVIRSNVDVIIPAGTTQAYIAAGWEGFRLIERQGHKITLHFYDADDGTNMYVKIPLVFDEGYASIDAAAIADIMGQMEEKNETGENPYGFAFWGWFTSTEFDAENRTSARTGRRRPTVGTTGFKFNTNEPIAFAWFDEYAINGNIDFYAIFSLWGDVNDDDDVTVADVTLIHEYLFDQSMILLGLPAHFSNPLNIHAGMVTIGAELSVADSTRIEQYLFDQSMILIGLPPYFNAVLGRP